MKYHESLLVLKQRIAVLTLKSALLPNDVGTQKARETQTNKYRLYIKQRGRCCFCKERMFADSSTGTKNERATIEHVKCKSLGGSDTIENFLLSCNLCNNRRGTRNFSKFSRQVALDGRPTHIPPGKKARRAIKRAFNKREAQLRFQQDDVYRSRVIDAIRTRPEQAQRIMRHYEISSLQQIGM